MNTKAQRALLIILALSTIASVSLAIYFYSTLARQQTAENDSERNALQKKLLDSEKRRHELESDLAALKSRLAEAPSETPSEDSPSADRNREADRTNRRAARGAEIAALWQKLQESPEYQKALTTQARGNLDKTYASLFKSLNLPPDQLAKFKDLLVEKQMAVTDAMSAARAQGLNPRDPASRAQFSQLLAQTNTETEKSIQQSLGAEGYATYQKYEQTLPQRNDVATLTSRLSYTPNPLQDAQAEQLVQILAANSAPRNQNAAATQTTAGLATANQPATNINPNRTAPITTQAVTAAQEILTQPQVAALAQIQAEQEAQRQMAQLMRNQFNPGGGNNQGSAGPAGGSGTAQPPSAKPKG